MRLSRFLLISVAVLSAATALAADTVGVDGSDVRYPVEATASIGDKKFPQKLSGVAMRKKTIFNVYTIGSYVSTDFTGKTAEDLAGCDMAKQLHLVMQRSVSGEDMAKAFEAGIHCNYPTEFNGELQKLVAMIKAHDTKTGDHIWITNIPGFGVHVNLVGKKQEFIPGVKFSRAIWEIYLGPKSVSEAVKRGLLARL